MEVFEEVERGEGRGGGKAAAAAAAAEEEEEREEEEENEETTTAAIITAAATRTTMTTHYWRFTPSKQVRDLKLIQQHDTTTHRHQGKERRRGRRYMPRFLLHQSIRLFACLSVSLT